MGLFDWLLGKKKQEEIKPYFDPTKVKLEDLRPGWLVDFDMKTWEVIARHRYDMGDGFEMIEWELRSSNEIRYLCREEDDGIYWTLMKKVPLGAIDPGLKKHILQNEDPPQRLQYEGMVYEMVSYGGAKFFKNGMPPAIPFLYWEYESSDGTKVITVEQWGDTEFEASAGEYVEEYQFSNILPRE
jgi:hypothetical protein